jgi:hypothetical protein
VSAVDRLPTALRALAARWRARLSGGGSNTPLMLVFSKDRAIQLELFLRSYAQKMSRPLPLTIMYRASSDAHRAAYEKVFAGYTASPLTVIAETRFKPDLLAVMRGAGASKVIFFVDDIVFVQPIDTDLLESWRATDGVLSLRLGKNIDKSFNSGNVPMPAPAGLHPVVRHGVPLLAWRWVEGQYDWSLPTSLDGHMLPLAEMIPLIAHTQFKAPNSMEGAIGQYKFLFKWNDGVCFEQARILNLPLNSVKTEDYDFPHQGWDAEELLQAFNDGLRLDVSALPLAEHDSCHMAWLPTLRKVDAVG